MSATTPRPLETFHFDRKQLLEIADAHRDSYAVASPFPHVVIDDFLPPEVLDEVLREFPSPQRADWHSFDSPLERKLATKDDAMLGEATRHLLAEFNSAPFIDFLERLTGIEGLVPDPHFSGGGLHQIERGGHLKVHADFNRHPHTQLLRRLNVLVYLNRDWKDEFGGGLELWSRDMKARERQILPLFNRCVVFSTTDTSFHGHPEPLNCPEGMTRKSIALYYYSSPGGEGIRDHNTLFQARPGEELPLAETDNGAEPRQRVKDVVRLLVPPILFIVRSEIRRRRAAQA